jgi:hypothetical protein
VESSLRNLPRKTQATSSTTTTTTTDTLPIPHVLHILHSFGMRSATLQYGRHYASAALRKVPSFALTPVMAVKATMSALAWSAMAKRVYDSTAEQLVLLLASSLARIY